MLGSIRITAPYRSAVGVAAAALTSSGNVHAVSIQAMCPGHTIYIGGAGVTTATGYPMADGKELVLEVRNANEIYAISDAAAQSLAVLPISRVGY